MSSFSNGGRNTTLMWHTIGNACDTPALQKDLPSIWDKATGVRMAISLAGRQYRAMPANSKVASKVASSTPTSASCNNLGRHPRSLACQSSSAPGTAESIAKPPTTSGMQITSKPDL